MLDVHATGQHSAYRGEGHLDADAGIRGTAHHLHGFAPSGHLTHAQFVGIRVLLGSQNFADYDAAERGCRRSKAFEFETG